MGTNDDCGAGRGGAFGPPQGEGGRWNSTRFLKSIESRKLHGNSRLAKIGLPKPRVKKRPGAPKGNRNALRTGLHTAEIRDLRRRIAAFHRRAKAAVAHAEDVIAGYKRLAREAAEAAAAQSGVSPHPANPLTASESEAGPLAPHRP